MEFLSNLSTGDMITVNGETRDGSPKSIELEITSEPSEHQYLPETHTMIEAKTASGTAVRIHQTVFELHNDYGKVKVTSKVGRHNTMVFDGVIVSNYWQNAKQLTEQIESEYYLGDDNRSNLNLLMSDAMKQAAHDSQQPLRQVAMDAAKRLNYMDDNFRRS